MILTPPIVERPVPVGGSRKLAENQCVVSDIAKRVSVRQNIFAFRARRFTAFSFAAVELRTLHVVTNTFGHQFLWRNCPVVFWAWSS